MVEVIFRTISLRLAGIGSGDREMVINMPFISGLFLQKGMDIEVEMAPGA